MVFIDNCYLTKRFTKNNKDNFLDANVLFRTYNKLKHVMSI